MNWPLKLTFRPKADKEITKEIKVDSSSCIFTVLIMACEVFGIQHKQNFVLLHKKKSLSLFESIQEANLAQGSTLFLQEIVNVKERHDVSFNYKVRFNSGVINSICKYRSDDYLINCLQNIPIGSSEKLNALIQSDKSPIISILSAKIFPKDIILLQNFSLNSLGLKGNYSVSVSYEKSTEFTAQFTNFLSNWDIPKLDSRDSLIEKCNESKLPKISSDSCDAFVEDNQVKDDISNLKFTIFHPTIFSNSSPEVPDSFFELSKAELLDFQKGLQKKSELLNSRPLVSVKSKTKVEYTIKERVHLKLIFPDQMQVQVDCNSSFKIQAILDFINTKIFDFPSDNIELWIGPPYQMLESTLTLFEAGINGPTRVIVKCNNYSYRKDLN